MLLRFVVVMTISLTKILYHCLITVVAGDGDTSDLDVPREDNLEQERVGPTSDVGRKRLKSGMGYKRSGLREGMARGHARTVHFKYEVVMQYRRQQERKKLGIITDPGTATVSFFGGITHGQVSGWAKMEEKLRAALLNENQRRRKGRKCDPTALVNFKSRAARKFTLHSGGNRKFAAAEAEVHALYKERREKGLRVKGHFLRIQMKRCVARIYGEETARLFKASRKWLFKFTKHYNMSLRVITNKKNQSVEERAAKCKRWHARFRRRLKRGTHDSLHPVWGRWLPENRISLDQVQYNVTNYVHPCMLRAPRHR